MRLTDKYHLIRPEEITELSRPCSCDEDVLQRYIEESEMQDIKPAIGDALFLRLMTHVEYARLLNGGEYEDQHGNTFIFAGLKTALAYYVYARIVKSGTQTVSRFGFVEKDDEYSSRSDFKHRHQAYNDAFSIADGYMKECLAYIQNNPDIFPDYTQKGKMKTNRIKFKVIGSYV